MSFTGTGTNENSQIVVGGTLATMGAINQVAKENQEVAKGDQKKFLSLYEQTKTEIANNPEMLYKNYWKKRR